MTTLTLGNSASIGMVVSSDNTNVLNTSTFDHVSISAATLTSVIVTPASTSVRPGGTKQFTAVAMDQFGLPLAVQPTFTWAVTGL